MFDPQKGPITNPKDEDDDDEEDDEVPDLPVIGKVASSALRWRKRSKKKIVRHFERRYTELGPMLKLEQKRIDYVLVHPNVSSSDVEDIPDNNDKRRSLIEKEFKRDCFENALLYEGFSIQKDAEGSKVFTKLHCPFKRLCMEAELVKLEMRLKGVCS